jgi:hypothetical protein
MAISDGLPETRITTLSGALIAIAIAATGIALLYWTGHPTAWASHPRLQTLLQQLGSLLVVAVALAFLWDLFGRRVFVNELYARAGVAQDLRHAGLVRIVLSPNDVDWKPLLDSATEIDVFFTYARSWRGQFYLQLQEFPQRKHSVLRVILPDPDDLELMQSLGRRFDKHPDKQAHDIREASDFFQKIIDTSKNAPGRIEIWYTKAPPVLSIYRFDRVAVLAMYPHKTKVDVPHFICHRGGTLFDFAVNQLDALTTPDELSRLVATNIFPSSSDEIPVEQASINERSDGSGSAR